MAINRVKIDLTGMQFSFWTVISYIPRRGKESTWLCRCICGMEKQVSGKWLRKGLSRSCGCKRGQFISASNHYSQEDFVKQAIAVWGAQYDYSLVQYVKTHIHVVIVCNVHGAFRCTPNNHLRGCGCRPCGVERTRKTRIKSSRKTFKQRAIKIHGERYDYKSVRYKGMLKPVTIICKVHGKFSQLASNHIRGHGCPKCYSRNHSCGEKRIENWLVTNNIKFKKQAAFQWLVNPETNKPLRFDFLVQKIKLLIEFDGSQHFNVYNNDELKLMRTQKRDELKDELARKHGFRVLRIPFFKIEETENLLQKGLYETIEV